VLEPSIRCQYYCRESIPKLSKQYFDYGFWRFNTLLKHPSSFTYRQAVPVLLCVSLAASFLLIIFGAVIGWLIPLIYMVACLFSAIKLRLDHKQPFLLATLLIIFPALHISWGVGFLKNTVTTAANNCFRKKETSRQ